MASDLLEIKRQPVNSSNIKSVGYDSGSQTLDVEFHGGAVYRYFDVPQKVHKTLAGAKSVGRVFHAHVRNVYKYERMGSKDDPDGDVVSNGKLRAHRVVKPTRKEKINGAG